MEKPSSLIRHAADERARLIAFEGTACNGSGTTENTGTTSSSPSGSCIFHDVVTGDNSQECTTGSPYVYSNGGSNGILSTSTTQEQPAYLAASGYDLATGIGSINIRNLVTRGPLS